MEGTGPVRASGKEVMKTQVNQDAGSWSKLDPGICDMILEKLPCLERLRLREVCKEWNCIALKRVECKPYFVTFVQESLNGLVVYDNVSKSLSFKQLPVKFHVSLYKPCLAGFVVKGLIFSNHPNRAKLAYLRHWLCLDDDDPEDPGHDQWCVYSIHNRTTHFVPPAPGSSSRLSSGYFCGMMVDTSIKPYPFKLVVSYSTGEESQMYDSASRSWSLHPKSNPNSNSSLLLANDGVWYLCMCHKDCMYMSTRSAEEGVLVYSMEEDRWSTLSGSPFQGKKRIFVGAWEDRIFAVQHDSEALRVCVWELIDETQQVWVEFVRCSGAQYEQLMGYGHKYHPYNRQVYVGISDPNCEIVSVFSEEYVLMYNWHGDQSYALVMLNLKTREWQPVACIPNMIDEVECICLW